MKEARVRCVCVCREGGVKWGDQGEVGRNMGEVGVTLAQSLPSLEAFLFFAAANRQGRDVRIFQAASASSSALGSCG